MIESYRKAAVESAMSTNSAKNSFPHWAKYISTITNDRLSGRIIFDLGDHLREIFNASSQGNTRVGENTNSSVSAGGAAWESLVCWYLNLCLIGSNVVVIKSKKDLLPRFITDAIAVKYNNFKSNTEADLIYIAFPKVQDWPEKGEKELFSTYFDRVLSIVFSMKDISIGVIQTKTNWNDNAQIPMLWDMVYSAKGFGRNVTVGSKGRSIESFASFTYSFVTVPSQKDIDKNYKVTSTSVNRVRNISGGNYWGLPTKDGVADSLNEFIGRNLSDYIPEADLIGWLDKQVALLETDYSYFGLQKEHSKYLIQS
ncbi:hypothetical protein [Paraglaciecola arctica]|uniref:Uncharacterized protein n=1 Tax=Paraglaciecola arctica BSs20135 TaxID=493475 RepID=K6XA47_9ALTE|nr:hypothetical protein [Paraglaciecola arctica]GAC17494.1 hypothetical protein GARC_0513 [Paraglaciecola arctica BSs20135]